MCDVFSCFLSGRLMNRSSPTTTPPQFDGGVVFIACSSCLLASTAFDDVEPTSSHAKSGRMMTIDAFA